ncbi:unnamed protein product, partial [Closterium sp. NIES-54]
ATMRELKRAGRVRAQAGAAALPAPAFTALQRRLLQCCHHPQLLSPAPCPGHPTVSAPRPPAPPAASATAAGNATAAAAAAAAAAVEPAAATPAPAPMPASASDTAAAGAAAAEEARPTSADGTQSSGKLRLLSTMLACLQRKGKTVLLLAH